MERMCEIVLLKDKIPNWIELNKKATAELSNNLFDTVSYSTFFIYCEECDTEMYWPILDIETSLDPYKHFERVAKAPTNASWSYMKEVYKKGDIEKQFIEPHQEIVKINKIGKEIRKKVDQIHECPFCNAKLIRRYGYSYTGKQREDIYCWYKYNENKEDYPTSFSEEEYMVVVKNAFNKLRIYREKEQKKIEEENSREFAKTEIDRFAEKNKEHTDNSLVSVDPIVVKSSTENMKIYLHSLLQMETSIISLSKRLQRLYEAKELSEYELKRDTKKNNSAIHRLSSKINQKEALLRDYSLDKASIDLHDPQYPQEPSEPIYQKPGLFNKKKVEEANRQLENEYQEKLEKYQMELQDFENRKKKELSDELNSLYVELRKAESSIDTSPVISMLGDEIEQAESVLQNAYLQRNNMYNLDIVFMKYRNPVAISSFYEYLMSGRCTVLEGVDGAYNIYETESRLNQITTQLDQVIDSLESIKQNQFVIYSEIQEMNMSLQSLEASMNTAIDSMSSMNRKLDGISENTAVTAYYSKVNAYYAQKTAQLTNAIGWLVALK